MSQKLRRNMINAKVFCGFLEGATDSVLKKLKFLETGGFIIHLNIFFSVKNCRLKMLEGYSNLLWIHD